MKQKKATANNRHDHASLFSHKDTTQHSMAATPPTPSRPREYPRAAAGMLGLRVVVVGRGKTISPKPNQNPQHLSSSSHTPPPHDTATNTPNTQRERPSHARPLRRHRFCHGPKTEPGTASAQEASAADGGRRRRSRRRRRGAPAHLSWLSQLGARIGRWHAGGVESR